MYSISAVQYIISHRYARSHSCMSRLWTCL